MRLPFFYLQKYREKTRQIADLLITSSQIIIIPLADYNPYL